MENPTQLELKHLSAYLPYGLELCSPYTLNGKTVWNKEVLMGKNLNDLMLSANKGYFKPLLRPLSECEQYLNLDHGPIIDSSILTLNNSLPSINIYPNGSEWTHSMDVYNNIYVWLFENHFDVFGLIDAGLAVSIHDIQQ